MIAGFLNSIKLLEPHMLMSDLLLSAACFFCYFDFKRKAVHIADFGLAKYWRRFFLFEGISFLAGGIAHGFYEYFGDTLHFLGWYASVIGVFYFTWGMMKISFDEIKKPVAYLLFAAIIISAVTSALYRAFWIIVAYCFLSMFMVIALNMRSRIISFKKKQSKGILIGTGLFLLAAAAFIFKLTVFNIESGVSAHVLIAMGILFFGRGCLDTISELWQKNKEYGGETANI